MKEEIKIQNRGMFSRPPEEVAAWLLGKTLCRRISDNEVLRLRITETEAYREEEEFCYGHCGKVTKTNKPLFGQKGVCCLFGGMLLIICGREGKPDNVLLRCAGNLDCYHEGPYQLYQALAVKGGPRTYDLLAADSDLWLEGEDEMRECSRVPRVGLGTKGKAEDQNRFILL